MECLDLFHFSVKILSRTFNLLKFLQNGPQLLTIFHVKIEDDLSPRG